MNLLDKYMVQVGKHLPRKNRLDLQAEIRSTIEDMLEDRGQQSGKPVDDDPHQRSPAGIRRAR